MKIRKITVKNFRLLESIPVDLEEDITLIIGKNNTGKTSFFEAIKLFVGGEDKLSFEDFSQSTYLTFKEVQEKYQKLIGEGIAEKDKEEIEIFIQRKMPKIELVFEIEYDKDLDSLIEISEFITDLDDARTEATILISYESTDTFRLLKSYHIREDTSLSFIKYLKENITSFYKLTCYAINEKSDYKKEIEGGFKDKIKKIVSFEEIKALRILDDKKGDRNNTLALGFSKYYKERDKTKSNVKDLEKSLKVIAKELKEKYNNILSTILHDLTKFGAATPINIPDITIDSEFNSEAIIKNNIKYYYKQGEIDLPESYNGLGYSNLIYMVLELASFIEKFKNAKEEKISEFLVVLIEEPEAHMHPQMQQVFINQIKGIVKEAREVNILVQLIITSHSSHIISEAGIDLEKGFNRIRYFNKISNGLLAQDFNSLTIRDEKRTFRFLKQYLNLHRSDLFFADKVIMVEGTTERMLLPQMIRKVAPSLLNEYLTILEVGGAYTHKFKEILEFLQVKTLIITDLDSVDHLEGKRCPVNNGDNKEVTSNETLKSWVPRKETIKDLISCKYFEKIENEIIKVSFQTSENGHISRSFEEAFINSNMSLITGETTDESGKSIKHKNQFSLFKKQIVESTSSPYDLAPEISKVKTNFAFDIMSFQEEIYGQWTVPHYIKEGLEWLAGMCILPKN